ncbi:hypothetical protein [Martelella endophytica]|nr:hypothetical protein [Martelella endophytica]
MKEFKALWIAENDQFSHGFAFGSRKTVLGKIPLEEAQPPDLKRCGQKT